LQLVFVQLTIGADQSRITSNSAVETWILGRKFV
jgi:hypothetical protein